MPVTSGTDRQGDGDADYRRGWQGKAATVALKERDGPVASPVVKLSAAVRDWRERGELVKAVKYTAVSVVSVAVSQLAFVIVYGVARWGPRASAIFATCVGTVPSYYLNRNWAWGKSGRSHLWREVVPFWALAFLGLVFSTWAADFAHTHTVSLGAHHHIIHTAVVAAAYLGAFGVLWIGKFIIFNRWLFIDHSDDEPSMTAAA